MYVLEHKLLSGSWCKNVLSAMVGEKLRILFRKPKNGIHIDQNRTVSVHYGSWILSSTLQFQHKKTHATRENHFEFTTLFYRLTSLYGNTHTYASASVTTNSICVRACATFYCSGTLRLAGIRNASPFFVLNQICSGDESAYLFTCMRFSHKDLRK